MTAAIFDSEVRAWNSCEAWMASPRWDLSNDHHPLWGYSMLHLAVSPHCDIFATQCDISWWQLIP